MNPWYLGIALCLVDGFLCHELMKAWDAKEKQQANDPLTLEELWEMDGNPVWDPNLSEWGIVDIHGFNGKGCIRYVNNWWHSRGLMRGRFYRRKPEENGL